MKLARLAPPPRNPVAAIARETEWLCSTYKLTPREAVWEWPEVLTMLFMPAYNARQGAKPGVSDAADKASSIARLEMRAILESLYEIVDDPASVTGWRIGNKPTIIP